MRPEAGSSNRIAILLPNLRPGGAEHLHVRLACEWVRRGIGVDVVLRQAEGELLCALPSGVRIVNLEAERVRNSFRPLRRYLKDSPPHAILSAMWPLTIIAPLAARSAGFRGRVVISEHAPQSLSYPGRGAIHRMLMRSTMGVGYRLADARVGVSSGVADDMAALSGVMRSDFDVIFNAAATGQVEGAEYSVPPFLVDRSGSIVLSVGSLKAVKRHDILIRAFAELPRQDALLCIIGEGRERTKLESLIGSLGLQDRVLLAGHQKDPAAWYAHSDLFVLSSDHEGFGNVIVEALEHGLPVVSTNCPTGPNEILGDGKYGALVPVGDVGALAKGMEDALSRDHDHELLKRRSREFSVERAADAYLRLLLPGVSGGLG